ncbi:MAG TPA: V-type ATP synthase subunit I [Candidatus Nanoarchaeia archaeon]|nr:V-type ATP synthase subunit I [Candidatus Nanoarchaeia archaeon]
MIVPEKMSRITVIGLQTEMGAVIERLHSLKACHIKNHTKKSQEDLDIARPLSCAEQVSSMIIDIRSLCSTLEQNSSPGLKIGQAAVISGSLANAASMIIDTGRTISQAQRKTAIIIGQVKAIEEALRRNNDEQKLLETINPLDISLESFAQYSSLTVFIGFAEQVKNLSKSISSLTDRHSLKIAADSERKNLIALFIDKEFSVKAQDILAGCKFSAIDLSQLRVQKGKPSKRISELKQDSKELLRVKDRLQEQFDDLARRSLPQFRGIEEALKIEAVKAESPLRFAATERTFILTGWIPSAQEKTVASEIEKSAKGKIYVGIEKIHRHVTHDSHAGGSAEAHVSEEVPIKFKNPKAVQPFEFFMNLYTLPQYKEIDPSFLMFLSFPIFYGFMLGDMGYGLVTLALFLWLKPKIPGEFGKLVTAMIYGSISAIFFGALFGELFGLEKIGHLELPHLISRAEQINELMLVAIAIGVVHINIGLIVGFYNKLRQHGLWHAFTEKISWILLEVAVVCFALAYNPMFGLIVQKWVGASLFFLAAMLLYLGEGPKGLIELPSIFTNILSYARLMAVGLASVILATVVNELAGEMFHLGIVGILGGIILLVIGHAINIMLGLISPFLHATRLHYVEFFGKFYEGGGLKFLPFGAKEEL